MAQLRMQTDSVYLSCQGLRLFPPVLQAGGLLRLAGCRRGHVTCCLLLLSLVVDKWLPLICLRAGCRLQLGQLLQAATCRANAAAGAGSAVSELDGRSVRLLRCSCSGWRLLEALLLSWPRHAAALLPGRSLLEL